jgi:putative hydroxymethylpyrimidine transport system permease protein
MRRLRPLIIVGGLVLLWQAVVSAFDLPHFILPGPAEVAAAWWQNAGALLVHARYTVIEIVLGLVFGVGLGSATALAMAYFRPARDWLLPVLVISQAVPVFALAPILVLWLGFGVASKIAMATLIIYFPVTAAFFDGLRRTDPGWLDLARTMGGGRLAILREVRVPSALPALGSGVRVATAVAPIGAVIGEWVGASAGLGYIMLHANARTQTALMFAALLTLAVIAVALYYAVDGAVRRLTRWQAESNPTDDPLRP